MSNFEERVVQGQKDKNISNEERRKRDSEARAELDRLYDEFSSHMNLFKAKSIEIWAPGKSPDILFNRQHVAIQMRKRHPVLRRNYTINIDCRPQDDGIEFRRFWASVDESDRPIEGDTVIGKSVDEALEFISYALGNDTLPWGLGFENADTIIHRWKLEGDSRRGSDFLIGLTFFGILALLILYVLS